jgi:ubiquinone/menaquinone biosynthesis C-methylase UbiE
MMNPPLVLKRFQNKDEELLWFDLREQIHEAIRAYSGNDDPDRMTRITNNWFNDKENYDGRWAVISARFPEKERVLDMAAGCGTFLLHGLHLGFDAWGVEPEAWKQDYFAKKITASAYPDHYRQRLISGRGEALPFPDAHFGLVTSYQTLEHVRDVRKCLGEMLRVLKPGGVLYVRAPDYSGFFEPHYGLPFLPKMNKVIAAFYLQLLGRPLAALRELNWITEKQIVSLLHELPYPTEISRTFSGQPGTRSRRGIFPNLKQRLVRVVRSFKEEKQIDLWVKKTK